MNSVVSSPSGAVQDDQLVEAARRGALGRGAVVADDVVDERVVEDLELAERVEQPAHVVVGVLEEARVDLHLAREHRLQVVRHVVPGRNLLRPLGQLRLGRDHAELLLSRERPLAQCVPAVVEDALVLVRPLGPHMVRGMRGARRVVDEERLVGHQRLLLRDPVDRVIGHVLREVVPLLGCPVGLHGDRVLVDRRRVLVRLAADEAVEVLEARARRPRAERAHGARLPDRHLVALPELRGRVAVQLQRLGERREGVRPDRVVARRRGRDLRDPAHADRVVVAACEERLAGRRAERGRVEAVVLEAVRREALGCRRRDRPAERARRREADVVEQDNEHVGRALRRPERLDRRERGRRILRVIGDEPRSRPVGDRQNLTLHRVLLGSHCSCSSRGLTAPRDDARTVPGDIATAQAAFTRVNDYSAASRAARFSALRSLRASLCSATLPFASP